MMPLGKSSTYTLKANSFKWYTFDYKTCKGTGAGVFRPGIKYSEPMQTYPQRNEPRQELSEAN